MSITRQGDPVP